VLILAEAIRQGFRVSQLVNIQSSIYHQTNYSELVRMAQSHHEVSSATDTASFITSELFCLLIFILSVILLVSAWLDKIEEEKTGSIWGTESLSEKGEMEKSITGAFT
jgi:hypothetical protein